MFDGVPGQLNPSVSLLPARATAVADLSREEFEAWLRSFPPDTLIAARCSTSSCPIAKWLKNRGYVFVTVTADEWSYNDEEGRTRVEHHMPTWAYDFVVAIDNLVGRAAVTAARSLDVLKNIQT